VLNFKEGFELSSVIRFNNIANNYFINIHKPTFDTSLCCNIIMRQGAIFLGFFFNMIGIGDFGLKIGAWVLEI
jgi:hypothetical protein